MKLNKIDLNLKISVRSNKEEREERRDREENELTGENERER